MRLCASAEGPVILADTQDNPGGGAASDTVGVLTALVEADAQDAVVALMYDPAVAAGSARSRRGRAVQRGARREIRGAG